MLADDDPASSSGERSLGEEESNHASLCYRCEAHNTQTIKSGLKPMTEFHCDVGMKSVIRAIRKVLLAKILAHVKRNKSLEEGIIGP